ncbi:hypothetical protein [Plantactinospora sp. CA-290183]|uniref:hypothetical protein n=1 Tax=Plantactinospora sp. CA-290183 TaxID=3240006 RepID=UPI003D8A0479
MATALVRRGPWVYIVADAAVSERCLFQLDSLAKLAELVHNDNEPAFESELARFDPVARAAAIIELAALLGVVAMYGAFSANPE